VLFVADKERLIGVTVSVLRDGMPQQTVADAMRERGHRWSQSTVWSIEKGERRLLLSEAADLAEVLDVPVDALLKRPDEIGLQSDIAGQCRIIETLYAEGVWTMYELSAAHKVLDEHLEQAMQKGFRLALVTGETISTVKAMTPEHALEEAENLNGEKLPQTREDFGAMRRPSVPRFATSPRSGSLR
jgi:transcriptional regulator with XRE-family HTH domain